MKFIESVSRYASPTASLAVASALLPTPGTSPRILTIDENRALLPERR